jgi:hypothetical protein
MYKFKKGHEGIKDGCKSGRKRSIVTDKSTYHWQKCKTFTFHISGTSYDSEESLESRANNWQMDTQFPDIWPEKEA